MNHSYLVQRSQRVLRSLNGLAPSTAASVLVRSLAELAAPNVGTGAVSTEEAAEVFKRSFAAQLNLLTVKEEDGPPTGV